MTTPRDPGWIAALSVAGRIATGRTPEGSMLLVMRGAVLFLEIAAVAAGGLVVLLGAGSRQARIGEVASGILLSASIGLALIGLSAIGREGPDVADQERLAVSVFRITMRRVLVAATLAPVGMALSWASGDASFVLFGTSTAMLLMAVASPTARRLAQFQSEIEAAGSDLSVVTALRRSYR